MPVGETALSHRVSAYRYVLPDYMGLRQAKMTMRIVVKAVSFEGVAVSTEPLSKKDAIMKVWELKTSGYTQIRTVDATTNAPVEIVRKGK